jgi:hypothetical protein
VQEQKPATKKSELTEALFILDNLNFFDNNIQVKKKPRNSEASGDDCRVRLGANYIDKGSVMAAPDTKLNLAFCLRIKCVVLTTTNIVARVKFGAALAHNNIAGDYGFTAEFFDAESF